MRSKTWLAPELKWDWTHVLMFASQSSESSGSTLWTESSSLKEDPWQRFHKINLTVGRLWKWWKVCLTSRTPYIPFKIKKNLFNLILKSSAVKSHILYFLMNLLQRLFLKNTRMKRFWTKFYQVATVFHIHVTGHMWFVVTVVKGPIFNPNHHIFWNLTNSCFVAET